MPMNNPPHPGEIVRSECLEPLGLTVTRAAQGLGVTRQALSDLVNEKAGVSVDMAFRLSQAFGSTPETWLGPADGLRSLAGTGTSRAYRGREIHGSRLNIVGEALVSHISRAECVQEHHRRRMYQTD